MVSESPHDFCRAFGRLIALATSCLLATGAQAFTVNMYEFAVSQTYVGSGTPNLPYPPTPPYPSWSMTDSFEDGIPPPSGPLPFPPPGIASVYTVLGSYSGSESGGALTLNTAQGQYFPVSALGPVNLQRAQYNGYGLGSVPSYSDYEWTARGVFDVTDPARGGYGIAFTNFSTSGLHFLSVAVRPGSSGTPELRLYETVPSAPETVYGAVDLDEDMGPIEIELRQMLGLVTGWWRYEGAADYTPLGDPIALQPVPPGVVWNFAEFRAFAPVPEPNALALVGVALLAGLFFSARRNLH